MSDFISSVAVTFDRTILVIIYSYGAYTPEQLHKRYLKWMSALRLSVWWTSARRLALEALEDDRMTQAECIRYMFSGEYTEYIDEYPQSAIDKLRGIGTHIVPYTGDRRSDIRRWIQQNLNAEHLAYVGI